MVNLREKVSALESERETLRSQIAVRNAHSKFESLNTRAADAARDKLIASCGGNAKWFSMTLDQRLSAQGQSPATNRELREVEQYFGKTSDSQGASTLAKQWPESYRRLRMIAREIGLL